jgi:hypothetical protein
MTVTNLRKSGDTMPNSKTIWHRHHQAASLLMRLYACEFIFRPRASLFVMAVLIHPHARERMQERGATEPEVRMTISKGEKFPAKFGRTGYRHDFPFKGDRDGKFFQVKQVIVYGVDEDRDFIVVTVVVKYF